MWQLVKLPKLPAGEGGVSSTTDGRWVLMILLPNKRKKFEPCVSSNLNVSYLKVPEERVHQDVKNNQWGEYRIENAHKNEPPL